MRGSRRLLVSVGFANDEGDVDPDELERLFPSEIGEAEWILWEDSGATEWEGSDHDTVLFLIDIDHRSPETVLETLGGDRWEPIETASANDFPILGWRHESPRTAWVELDHLIVMYTPPMIDEPERDGALISLGPDEAIASMLGMDGGMWFMSAENVLWQDLIDEAAFGFAPNPSACFVHALVHHWGQAIMRLEVGSPAAAGVLDAAAGLLEGASTSANRPRGTWISGPVRPATGSTRSNRGSTTTPSPTSRTRPSHRAPYGTSGSGRPRPRGSHDSFGVITSMISPAPWPRSSAATRWNSSRSNRVSSILRSSTSRKSGSARSTVSPSPPAPLEDHRGP